MTYLYDFPTIMTYFASYNESINSKTIDKVRDSENYLCHNSFIWSLTLVVFGGH